MEPVTKFFISLYGGMALTGIYETANQLIIRLRSLLTTANQTIVPIVAKGLNEGDKRMGYSLNFDYLTLISGILFLSLISTSSLFSIILIGQIQISFMFILALIAMAYFLNSVCLPAFFMNIGDGNVLLNTKTMIFQALLLLVLGFGFEVYLVDGI